MQMMSRVASNVDSPSKSFFSSLLNPLDSGRRLRDFCAGEQFKEKSLKIVDILPASPSSSLEDDGTGRNPSPINGGRYAIGTRRANARG